ncbi:hypothetical protein LWI29_006877 [Acer saccharum]|uniref:NAD(P)H-quinone oxidoreductase subunit L, chloroplastic n=1 Tax=Acer saccharum TaxID=4024 RepID=A0AA39RH44_ACESA|nr:hypothetical protein LWI29_006877 [Acer saccharum]KAK1582281.1 hypothetical protein Q3G72_013563 [Acer saccharum]
MSSFFSLQIPKALPSLSSSSVQCTTKTPFYISSKLNPTNPHKKLASITQKAVDYFDGKGSAFAIQAGALVLATPALAVTGENNYVVDLNIVIIKLGAIAFWYFLIMPPIILNWLRLRWYRRKLLEMYFQFMFVFLFYPGIMVWAPFLNFRKFPRDPSMKYPWSVPEDPSKVRNAYAKFPWADPEDYD